MVFTLLLYVILLSMLFGGLGYICGEKQKGSQIFVNCITALLLYMIIVQLAHSGLPAGSAFAHGIPFINHIQQAGGIRLLMHNSPGIFASDFVEFTTLILLIQWIAGLVSFPGAGLAGKITSGIVIVFIGILTYGFIMLSVKDNIVLKWCVYCVECVITGGSILYTPAMIVSYISGLKKGNYFNVCFSKNKFRESGILFHYICCSIYCLRAGIGEPVWQYLQCFCWWTGNFKMLWRHYSDADRNILFAYRLKNSRPKINLHT